MTISVISMISVIIAPHHQRMKRLLLPFGWLYNLVTRVRNHLYDIGYRKSFRFTGVYTISVGNLNMGGSGKTPVTEYLIRLLSEHYPVASLSRGYGRKTRGFRLLGVDDGAETGGDEPVQIFRKFGDRIQVAVSEDRSLAIPELLSQDPPPQVVIMDDAFQHRRVVPDLNILVTRFSEPFFRDRVFPVGWLREARSGARRADLVVFTKCPDEISDRSMDVEAEKARRYAGPVPVFFANYAYRAPVPFGDHDQISEKIILVTGIANSAFLLDHCKRNYTVIRHIRMADHHRFNRSEVEALIRSAGQEKASLLTTEKDMVRLMATDMKPLVSVSPWFYLPVEIRFLRDREEFDKLVIGNLNQKLNEPA